MEVKPDGPTTNPREAGPLTASGRNYSGAGIKTSVTGTVYQIELLKLFINRGLRANCTFNVATEVASAGAFDDLVFEYKTARTNGVLFLQAKHRTNLEKKIREIDLTEVVNGDFFVPKYFESYRKLISKSKEFKGDMKQFVIYTPINIDDDILHNFEEVSSSDEFAGNGFLYFDPNVLPRVPTINRIRKDSPLYTKLAKLLEKNIERSIVAVKLGKTIASNNAIIVEEVFKKHRDWLLEKVFDGDNITIVTNKAYIRFKESFLKMTEIEDVEVLEFKEIFMQSYNETIKSRGNKKENANNNNKEVSESEEVQNIIDILTEENAKFQVAKTFLTSGYKKLKTDDSAREEIESFFNKFVFATNQPNNEELKKIIQIEIGKIMKLVMDESEWLESRIQSCILDWLKIKEGRYLTNEDCKAFFDYVEQEFARRGQTYSSLANVSHIENCGYTFRKYGNLMGSIRKFLNEDGDVQILCVCYTSRLLTKIKLWQSRPCNQDFIFGELKTLSQQVGSEICPIKAFTSQSNNYIFLEIDNCFNLNNEEKGLLQKITEIVENDTKKRLLVMIAKDQQMSCKDILVNFRVVLDLENSVNDLSEESKEKLIKSATIRFGGRMVCLHEILDSNLMENLSDDTLCDLMMMNDALHIEFSPDSVQDDSVKGYFIERKFSCLHILNENILHQPQFHIIYDKSEPLNIELQETIHFDINDILRDTIKADRRGFLVFTTSSDKFSKVCEKYKYQNVHWLVKNDNFLIWRKSQGSISEIQKYFTLTGNNYKPEDVLLCSPIQIIIVKAAPGMGKSTVLSYLDTNINLNYPEYFCIRTNLIDHCQFLEDLDEENMTEESIKFLYKISRIGAKDCKGDIYDHITVLDNGKLKLNVGSRTTFDKILRISLFCHVYNGGNIILLLDAFDEISPLYNMKVIRLIQTLTGMKISKILITSRPYDVARELEDTLNSFSYILEPLSVDEQSCLLLHFWKKKLNIEICMNKVIMFLDLLKQNLFKHFLQSDEDHISTFMSIPLHVFMLATVEEKRFQDFLAKKEIININEEYTRFSVYTMYNEFFKIKFNDILYKETDNKVPKHNLMLRNIMKETMTDNGKLALLELFEDLAEVLVSDCTTLKQEVMIGNEKTGFVHIVEGKPRFVHRTYAEFFAAHFLADTILNSKDSKAEAVKFLYKIITEHRDKSTVVFVFFNYMVVSSSKYYPLFNAALNGNVQKVIENTADNKDDLGRTPFHLLFCTGLVYKPMLLFIFKKYRSAMFVPDNLFKWLPLHYVVVFHDCAKTLPCQKHELMRDLPEQDLTDINGRTPLILATQGLCKRVCVFNYIYDFSLAIDAKDNAGKTALHYAILNDFPHAYSLVSYFANLNVQDNKGKTALHYAMEMRQSNAVNVLIRRKADIKIRDNNGKTPVYYDMDKILSLYYFIIELEPEVSKFLFENMTLSRDELVAISQHSGISKHVWKKQKLNINKRDYKGKTALHYAVIENYNIGVIILKKLKANPNIRDNNHNTPLQYVTTNTYHSITFSLLEMGADIDVLTDEMLEKLTYLKSYPFNRDYIRPKKFCCMS